MSTNTNHSSEESSMHDPVDPAADASSGEKGTESSSSTPAATIEPGVAEMKDQLLRALAEAENTRRRAERDREEASKYAVANFARSLLSVADNLRRALAAVPQDARETDPRIDNLIVGIESTERELLNAFSRMGIKKIEAMDQIFNANFHEVMFEIPGSGKPGGTIMQVMEDGYTIHDRLLRPARVGVAKDDGSSAAPPTHSVDQSV